MLKSCKAPLPLSCTVRHSSQGCQEASGLHAEKKSLSDVWPGILQERQAASQCLAVSTSCWSQKINSSQWWICDLRSDPQQCVLVTDKLMQATFSPALTLSVFIVTGREGTEGHGNVKTSPLLCGVLRLLSLGLAACLSQRNRNRKLSDVTQEISSVVGSVPGVHLGRHNGGTSVSLRMTRDRRAS